jgi:hypothetical protein
MPRRVYRRSSDFLERCKCGVSKAEKATVKDREKGIGYDEEQDKKRERERRPFCKRGNFRMESDEQGQVHIRRRHFDG